MTSNEINAKSILRKYKKIDSWFISHYGMNLYRGCAHNCVYCDGRAESYYVDGNFGCEVAVKINSTEILDRELNPQKKRKPMKQSFIMIGGGVSDAYQIAEQKYYLSRKALELINKYKHSVHLLTKSTLVARDIDLLKSINNHSRAVVSMSFSSVDDQISSIFEPGCSPPSERLAVLKKIKEQGLAIGMFLMPVIPFITDQPAILEQTFTKAKEIGIDFIIHGGMTLKPGRQKDYFMKALKKHYPELEVEYVNLYGNDNKWGAPKEAYPRLITEILLKMSKKLKIPLRMPSYLWGDVVDQTAKVIIMLEHIDYILKLQGWSSPYSYAANSISKLTEPITEKRSKLRELKGIGPKTERLIFEILDTGKSKYYDSLLGLNS